MGPGEILIVLLVVAVFPTFLFLFIAKLCNKKSTRFASLTDLSEMPAASPAIALGTELARFDQLRKSGEIEEAHDYLATVLTQHRRQGSSREVQTLVAELLGSSLQESGMTEEAEKVFGLKPILVAEKSTKSLFEKALVNDNAEVTHETLKLLASIQGSWKPFRSAFIPFFYRLVVIVIALAGIIAIVVSNTVRPQEAEGLLALIAAFALLMLLVGISYRFYCISTTKYELKEGALIYRAGGLSQRSRTLELYRLHDVGVKRSVWNRLSGDARLDLQFDKEGAVFRLPGWVKANEIDLLAMTLRNVSRVLRTNANIKGILT